jgi:site-specific recombinase XerD
MKNKQVKKLFFAMTYEFLDVYMPEQIGMSPQTIRSYRDALTVFRRYLYEKRGVSISNFLFIDCTKDCLMEFVEHLKVRGCKAGTCNQRIAAIKSYMRYAADKDIALESIAMRISKIPSCKEQKTERETLSDEALYALLRQPPNTKMGLRNRTIMTLLYDSAIRISELLGLKLGDINIASKKPYIRVLGKGNRERIIGISTETAKHLKNYIELYHAKLHKDRFLFSTTIKGIANMMSVGNVERFIQQYADAVRDLGVDIPGSVYPHMLRRTRATNLYQDGVDLELVSKVLGHSKTETTKIYAKPSLEQMRTALESVEMPDQKNELPLWEGNEDEMARAFGLR